MLHFLFVAVLIAELLCSRCYSLYLLLSLFTFSSIFNYSRLTIFK